MMRGLKALSSFALLTFALSGCAPTSTAEDPSGGDGFVANVDYRDVTPQVSARRWKSPQSLSIVVGSKVEDAFSIEPAPSMINHYTDYRRSVGELLSKAFAENFADVKVVSEESGSGVEIVVLRAEMQASTTIKYGLALVWDGKELLDITGESEGMTIKMGGDYKELLKKYDGIVEELTDYTLVSFADLSYDALMRSDKLDEAGVYERLQEAAAAGEDAAGDEGSSEEAPE